MATNPTNPVWATFPVRPPMPNFPHSEIRADGLIYWTNFGLDYQQILWSSIQGLGGLIDQALIDLPNAGRTAADVQALLEQVGANLYLRTPPVNVADIRSLINDAILLALRPPPRPSPTSVLNEIPAGAIDGANVTFTLANVPTDSGISLFKNGLLQQPTTDYSTVGLTITMVAAPIVTDVLMANYQT